MTREEEASGSLLHLHVYGDAAVAHFAGPADTTDTDTGDSSSSGSEDSADEAHDNSERASDNKRVAKGAVRHLPWASRPRAVGHMASRGQVPR